MSQAAIGLFASLAPGTMSPLTFVETLAPFALEDFLERHWQQTPIHIPGKPDKFDSLQLDQARLFELLEAAPEAIVKAQSIGNNGDQRWQIAHHIQ